MEPLTHCATRRWHRGDCREQVAFPFLFLSAAARFRLHLPDTRLHRGAFLVRESVECLAGRGAPGASLTFSHSSSLSVRCFGAKIFSSLWTTKHTLSAISHWTY